MKWTPCLFSIAVLLGNNVMARALGFDDVESDKKEYLMTDRIRRCSTILAQMISSFCNYTFTIVKRDIPSSLILGKLIPGDVNEHMKRTRQKQWRRLRRQVASECCNHSCTVQNIVRYCPPDARVHKEHPEILGRL